VIGLLRRILTTLAGRKPKPQEPPPAMGESAERLDAAHRKLKQTIPPRED
jgi:hypothetical protein